MVAYYSEKERALNPDKVGHVTVEALNTLEK